MVVNVLEYLEISSQRFPNKTALAMREQKITFLELRKKAVSLGCTIQRLCHIQNQPIGVFVNRTIEPAIWFLGVLYSGNYYVPLDPGMPINKLQAIVNDSSFSVIIGTEEQRNIICELDYSGHYITEIDSNEEVPALPKIGGDIPAYMVYTSGSTGSPKGVLKSHSAIVSFIEAYCETFRFKEEEVIGNQTPFFFDASAKDFYLMLKTGATLEIIPSELFALPPMLIEYLNEKRITFASWVPTVLSIVAQLNPFSLVKPVTLKRLFFVGEVMPMKHLNRWRVELPHIQYVNLYGQSEIAGICGFYEVNGDCSDDSVLPIGKPLKNSEIYLCKNDEIIAEPNQLGEMYIVSQALALGYYHEEEKTSKAFVYKDFGYGVVRCFKTGDLAQYDCEGNLVFATRSDFQIKHMGHRIELGEIEAVAGSFEEIARCCCLYNPERKKIVLFCEVSSIAHITEREIRNRLKTKLSNYMVPGKVTILDQLPINANGKIDRKKLIEKI